MDLTYSSTTLQSLKSLAIETYRSYNTSFATLQDALSMGDKPIVGLDGNKIWQPQYDQYGNSLEQKDADHAVWVTGINYEFDGSVDIILNDSGTPNGCSSVVEYNDFMNTWSDHDSFVASADNSFV
ncbi:hypothetical protein [Pleurocapsa sp. FMAR1]|uniref:hypothetical protein n=1 Tax=Pleurocapsa sp. FMAR1 TaxID=3040204 RepID=UPI0029C88E99|nr:hypothetical protein [Pleurocapsa sp. FMAR1]